MKKVEIKTTEMTINEIIVDLRKKYGSMKGIKTAEMIMRLCKEYEKKKGNITT